MAEKKQSEATAQPAAAQAGEGANFATPKSDGSREAGSRENFCERQYCVFRAGRERFCLSVLEMEEVVEWPPVTRVPLTPAFLMGIFNLRGAIVPVIDIAFSEGRRPDLLPRHVVVAALEQGQGHDAMRLGIAADEVIGTFSSSEPLEASAAPREIGHCCGLLRHEENRLAMALDLKALAESFSVGVV